MQSSTSDLLTSKAVKPAGSWQCEDRVLTPASLRRGGEEAAVSACDGRPLTEDNPVCTSFKDSNLQPNLHIIFRFGAGSSSAPQLSFLPVRTPITAHCTRFGFISRGVNLAHSEIRVEEPSIPSSSGLTFS